MNYDVEAGCQRTLVLVAKALDAARRVNARAARAAAVALNHELANSAISFRVGWHHDLGGWLTEEDLGGRYLVRTEPPGVTRWCVEGELVRVKGGWTLLPPLPPVVAVVVDGIRSIARLARKGT